MRDAKTLAIIALALLLAYSAMVPPVTAQDGGTVPPCATPTRRPHRTPTPEATPTIIDPAYLGYDWLPMVGGEQ